MTYYIVLVILFMFGFAYNWMVAWFKKQGYHEGYSAIFVIGGVFATGLGFGVLRGIEEMMWFFGCFCVSGFWMFAGSYWRHCQEIKEWKEEAKEFNLWHQSKTV